LWIISRDPRRTSDSFLRFPVELRPLNNDPINLKMNNQPPKVLFETVAKVAGINVIWDPEYQPGRNLSLDLSNSTLEEALDDVAILTKSFWKAASRRRYDFRHQRQTTVIRHTRTLEYPPRPPGWHPP
jgi:general secretion pathway protein D